MPSPKDVEVTCRQCGCAFFTSRTEIARGSGKFCSRGCVNRYQRNENHPRWAGGERSNVKGYLLERKPTHPMAHVNGYVPKHRRVAQEKLGRVLHSSEVVHHINGNVLDNRPENLEVMTQSTHVLLHNRARSRSH